MLGKLLHGCDRVSSVPLRCRPERGAMEPIPLKSVIIKIKERPTPLAKKCKEKKKVGALPNPIIHEIVHHLSAGSRPLPGGHRIIGFHDVMFCVLEELPFKELCMWAATCKAGRITVKCVLKLRLSSLLKSYVAAQLTSFGDILTRSGGVIYGSIALWMLLAPKEWSPNNLNIIVPFSRGRRLLRFFEGVGYVALEESVEARLRSNIANFRRLTRGETTVTLAESISHSVFAPILASYTTFDLNAVTMESVVSLYPSLTFMNAGFACYGWQCSTEVADRLKRRRLGIYPHSVPWVGRCGYSCPRIRRKLYGLEGSAAFSWVRGEGDSGAGDLRLLAAHSHYAWVVNFCEWR
jgi:hypothetical protein